MPMTLESEPIQFGSVPDDMAGTVDVVLLSRALHHFMRFDSKGGYMTQALADMNKMLKPGGIVAVEQHRAPESSSDRSGRPAITVAEASRPSSKPSRRRGSSIVAQSEINANPQDQQPTEKDFVWRLPPTLATSQSDPELKAKMESIGESDRMTLKFRKPA